MHAEVEHQHPMRAFSWNITFSSLHNVLSHYIIIYAYINIIITITNDFYARFDSIGYLLVKLNAMRFFGYSRCLHSCMTLLGNACAREGAYVHQISSLTRNSIATRFRKDMSSPAIFSH